MADVVTGWDDSVGVRKARDPRHSTSTDGLGDVLAWMSPIKGADDVRQD